MKDVNTSSTAGNATVANRITPSTGKRRCSGSERGEWMDNVKRHKGRGGGRAATRRHRNNYGNDNRNSNHRGKNNRNNNGSGSSSSGGSNHIQGNGKGYDKDNDDDHNNNGAGDAADKRPRAPAPAPAPAAAESEFPRLDAGDPVHANRIQQRRKAVSKGKNTAGYDAYVKRVPKHRRHPRNMDTPSTPDHTLDIPARRWQGLVRAWRVALHKYDPPDLVNSFQNTSMSSSSNTNASTLSASGDEDNKTDGTPPKTPTVKEREIERAASMGLLVDLGNDGDGGSPERSGGGGGGGGAVIPDESSPLSVMTAESVEGRGRILDLDFNDMSRKLLEDDANSDSDDEIL